MRWVGYVSFMAKMRTAYKILFGKPEGKRPIVRPRPRWKNNIKVDLREIGLEVVDWVHVVQDGDLWWALGNT
jgi:hypothetical protein